MLGTQPQEAGLAAGLPSEREWRGLQFTFDFALGAIVPFWPDVVVLISR
jgi:hypothetical protein